MIVARRPDMPIGSDRKKSGNDNLSCQLLPGHFRLLVELFPPNLSIADNAIAQKANNLGGRPSFRNGR